jgi:hypothetical protein
MTGDIRIHPGRPYLPHNVRFGDLDHEMLAKLASVEGGTATTSWCDETEIMSWADWVGLQPYDKYSEPGIMRRIGDCMIEFAPSGAYVEDWRFQPSRRGPVFGLQLVDETGLDGRVKPRKGGLVVAGDYAILSIDRRQALPDGIKAQDFVRACSDPLTALEQVLDCSVDYCVKRDAGWQVEVSTDPRRQLQPFGVIACLQAGHTTGEIVEVAAPGERYATRRWRIDSFEPDVEFSLGSETTEASKAWLQSEADTLLAPIGKA